MLRITPAVVLATSWLAIAAAPASPTQATGPVVRATEGFVPGPGRWLRDLWLDRMTVPLGLAGPNDPSGTRPASVEF